MHTYTALRRLWPFVLVPLVALALFWPGLGGPFVFDDFPALVNNTRLHVDHLGFAEIARAAFSFEPGGGGRPLAMASFAINNALGGLDPWGYKFGGLVVHAINAALVYALVLRLLALAAVGERHRHVAAIAIAIAWAVHPLQVSTALYVVQRMETLSLTFVLLSLLAYLHGRQRQMDGRRGWPWLALCAPLVALGLASKETAALFPVYTTALELTLLQFQARSTTTARNWRWLYGVGTALALALFAFVIVPRYGSLETHVGRNFNTVERVLTQFRILPMYLGQILWPVPSHMLFYYDDLVPSKSLLSPPSTLLAGGFLLALLLSAWRLRRRMPLFALGVFWFFAAHAITSNVVPLELVFEHRNYFALLGVLLALADLVRLIPASDGPAIKYAAVAAFVIGIAAVGSIRAATWGNRLLLATELVSINPQSARAAHELGVTYYEMADGSADSPFFSLAEQQFERESQLPNASILADQAIILMSAGAHRDVEPARWNALLSKLRERPVTPETTSALFALLDNRYKGLPIDDAKLTDAFLIVFEKVSLPPYSYAQVADHVLKHLGDPALSGQLLMQAVEKSRDHPQYIRQLESALRAKGESSQADLVVEHAKQLQVIPE